MRGRAARSVDLLIVGGGPAALAAARAYRGAGGEGSVVMVTDEDLPPYRRPPLTKQFLRDPFPVEDLFLEPLNFFPENGIELTTRCRLAEVDIAARRATTSAGDEMTYRDILFATGSEPSRPSIPGADAGPVHVIRRVADSSALAGASGSIHNVIVMGSGFIGCEAAASLAMRGVEITLVTMEQVPQQERLGRHVGGWIVDWLSGLGVELRLGQVVDEIDATEARARLRLGSNEVVEADLIVMGTGVIPRTDVQGLSGLPMTSGRIEVDHAMRTSVPGVWAAGDVALAFNPSAGRRLPVEHWGEALAQGEVAGRTLAGDEASWSSVPGFWSTIGDETIKYRAWGDGFDDYSYSGTDRGFVVRYEAGGKLVGVLAHENDEAYEESQDLILSGRRL